MRAALDFERHIRIREHGQVADLGRIDYPNQARTPLRQRHQREGTGLGVKFRRRVLVRSTMTEVASQRRLRVGSAAHLDAGGRATQRVTPLGADCQTPRYRFAGGAAYRPVIIGDLDGGGLVANAGKGGQLACARFESGNEKSILDVVAKSMEPDLARGKANLGCPQQPPPLVDL